VAGLGHQHGKADMNEANGEAGDQALAELEARLFHLLRTKYKVHWREKNTGAEGEVAGEVETELAALREQIKAVFDSIRLIDRKYKIPPLRMFD